MKLIYNKFLREPTDFQNGFSCKIFGNEFIDIKFKGKFSVVTKPKPNNKEGYLTTVQNQVTMKIGLVKTEEISET